MPKGGDWTNVAGTKVSGSGTTWELKRTDLSGYNRQEIQIGFNFVSISTGTPKIGWFIEDLRISIPPIGTILELEEISSSAVKVRWEGRLSSYDVYVRESSGAWTLWLDDTVLTSSIWDGEANKFYGFYVVAKDSNGYSEASTEADAETLVVYLVKVKDLEIDKLNTGYSISFKLNQGWEGDVWKIQRSSAIEVEWEQVGTMTIGSNGAGVFEDISEADTVFYKAVLSNGSSGGLRD